MSLSGRAVLVVDDNAGVRKLIAIVLQKTGLRVLSAADGHTAADLVRTDPEIAIVLLNVKMPEPDGAQTLDLLLKIKPELPCCFVTGNPAPYSAPELLARGARAVFEKPFQIATLLQAVAGLLQGGETPTLERALVS
jgi:CheY-like chemotaxis protein